MSLEAWAAPSRARAISRPTRAACPLLAFSQFPLPEADHEEGDSKANENDSRNEKWPSARKTDGEQCRSDERDDRQQEGPTRASHISDDRPGRARVCGNVPEKLPSQSVTKRPGSRRRVWLAYSAYGPPSSRLRSASSCGIRRT